MIQLRDYQQQFASDIYAAWDAGAQAVLGVLPTGGGKTVVFSKVAHDHVGAVSAIVHRREIVAQISLAMARLEVVHRIVGPVETVRLIRREHLDVLGRSYIDPNAANSVVSVQTLTSRSAERDAALQRCIKQTTLAIFDEGHHYVDGGQWGRACHLFDHAKQLHVTATPERADGKGLGRHADGFIDAMVLGPTTKELIDRGYLSKFRYIAPASDLDVSNIPLTASGDINTREMRKRITQSHFVGNVVAHYLQHAAGKRAIVFANDVETAEDTAVAFRAASVPSAALSGKTPLAERARVLRDFEQGKLLALINVDLFDEGFDVPAVEVAILARVTESLAKFLQMVGRALRILEGKLEALIIDPVRNWERHGMPNWPRNWTLDRRERTGRSSAADTVPQRVCTGCTQPYEAFYPQCPYCGEVPQPVGRSTPRQVDGDLTELDVDGMAALLEQIRRADLPDDDYTATQIARNIPTIGRGPDLRRHRAAKYRRRVLRELIAWWCGFQTDRTQAEIYRRFYHRFGVDMATALTLNEGDTDQLINRIRERFICDINTASA